MRSGRFGGSASTRQREPTVSLVEKKIKEQKKNLILASGNQVDCLKYLIVVTFMDSLLASESIVFKSKPFPGSDLRGEGRVTAGGKPTK